MRSCSQWRRQVTFRTTINLLFVFKTTQIESSTLLEAKSLFSDAKDGSVDQSTNKPDFCPSWGKDRLPQGLRAVLEPEISRAGEKNFQKPFLELPKYSDVVHATKITQGCFREHNIDFISKDECHDQPRFRLFCFGKLGEQGLCKILQEFGVPKR